MSEEKNTDYHEFCEQWTKELLETPAVQEYCKIYQKYSMENFCKAYANIKASGLKWGEMYRRLNEEKQNEWIDAAFRHLSIIQQKKLFDAQCLWRAGQLEIKEIDITFDFRAWEEDILNCSFIAPITQQEVDWYCQYFSQNNAEFEQDWLQDWQDYDGIKAAYENNNENRDFPEWYDYHNGKTGNGVLLILPDIKGKKERFYQNLCIEDSQRHTPPVPYVTDPELEKPYMNIFDINLHIALAQILEDKQTRKLITEYLKGTEHHHTYENERANENLQYLSEIKDEQIPIEAHEDYRIALSRAVENYKLKKTIEHLPLAFQKYKATYRLGISLGTEKEKEQFKNYMNMSKKWKETILRGRELNGEPKDFNF
ncbi:MULTISPECIES: hypothetical protein [unclassified Chryseobacterium]|uniref:hypothetical protein n=1 Tax=unclassified Chryseobacterium TaxID=2593645 RepID=UPI000D368A0B|nr:MULTISPECIES: hypothetical protein [unclassified Chryseobacterium]PTT66912.1 hypothetical protein DBR25_21855 [Chryseobacterium sp. HMWF001]PVV57217.1 hypothetical protein DD829_08610 [Chryseobacterium sp. HMWF035]